MLENGDPRLINVEELKSRMIKPLISLRIDQTPGVDIIAEIISDRGGYLTISNPLLAMPVQAPNSEEIRLWLRPWSMSLGKDQHVILDKQGVLTYFEVANRQLVNLYISSTSEIQLATPDQIPRDNPGVIDMFSR